MRGVHNDNGINRDVPEGLIIMQMVNVKQPSLQLVIPIPHKKHTPKKKLEIRINKQERLKFLILKHLMHTPKKHVLLLKFLLPLQIEK
jgi:hypothetical protein